MANSIIRPCCICGKDTTKTGGYYLAGAYACGNYCRNKYYMRYLGCKTIVQANEAYKKDNQDDDSEYFYTDWA